MKLRQCQIVIDKNRLSVDIQSVFNKYDTIKKCVYILHEQDDTRPHYHIYLYFGSASVDIQQVAKWFCLGYKDEQDIERDGTQFVYRVRCHWTALLQYFSRGDDKPTILTR